MPAGLALPDRKRWPIGTTAGNHPPNAPIARVQQPGFFELSDRHAALSAAVGSLERLTAVVNFGGFCGPLTGSGKIRKFVLRDQWLAAQRGQGC